MQNLPMQVERLEKTIDELFEKAQDKFGSSDSLTKQSLQALMYLQGLKYDINSLQAHQENTCDT